MTDLGSNGRFGNQIFQYVFLYTISKKSGHMLLLPLQTDTTLNDYKRLSLFDVFEIDYKPIYELDYEALLSITVRLNETTPFHYDENIVKQIIESKENIDISGYFQSFKYFEKNDVKEILKIKPSLIQICENFLKPFENKTKISLHIRRGDMVRSPNHHLLSEEYNWRTINYMKEKFSNCVFIVFSEDIEYCKKTFKGSEFIFSTLKSVAEDFVCMTLCDHHIVNASSFSWWGAYLNEVNRIAKPEVNHTVIAPKRLFHKFDRYGNLDISEYYPRNWILFDDECKH